MDTLPPQRPNILLQQLNALLFKVCVLNIMDGLAPPLACYADSVTLTQEWS